MVDGGREPDHADRPQGTAALPDLPHATSSTNNVALLGAGRIVTIAQNSGRAQVSEFTRKPAEDLSGAFKLGQFQVLPLNKSEKSRRGMLWADVNGDGLADLLVAEPEAGQISVSLQRANGTLGPAKKFSTLAGVTDLAVGDWDGSGKPEIFLLSADERQLGVTRLDEKGGLPFPTLIPLEGRPLAMAVGKLRTGAKTTLAPGGYLVVTPTAHPADARIVNLQAHVIDADFSRAS